MLVRTITNNVSQKVKGVAGEDQLFVDCLCEMLENVEKQSRFTKDESTYHQLKSHSEVIRTVLARNLTLG